MPKILLLAALALVGLMALAAAFTYNGGRADPALTRSNSVLPPPILEHQFGLNTAHARRFTRWDCSDWEPYPAVADAEDELASSILETLASNRGKTLYCGLDQSDTWTKRQVYDNAHMHNDRDRTQYDGSQGQGRFRGFTAGQEGWLTDGEHGITGVSPERIFEFPEVKKKRRRYKTVVETTEHPIANTASNTDGGSCGRVGGLICSGWGGRNLNPHSNSYDDVARAIARRIFAGQGGINDWTLNWQSGPSNSNGNTDWAAKANEAVEAACRARGWRFVSGAFAEGHSNHRGSGRSNHGANLGWFYHNNSNIGVRYAARMSRTWTGVCLETKRRRVRR